MISYRLIGQLRLTHERWDGPPPLTLRPTGETRRLMKAEDILVRPLPGGLEFHAPEDPDLDAEQVVLVFDVLPDDPLVQTFTAGASGLTKDEMFRDPEEKTEQLYRGYAVLALDAGDDGTPREVGPADWIAATEQQDPFARITVTLDMRKPLDLIVAFPAISTYWAYVVTGRNLPKGLEIDGGHFEAPETVTLPGGMPAIRLRSTDPRPARLFDAARFELIATKSPRRSLISPLPVANTPPRVIPETGAFETEIYVTVNLQSKGGH